MINFFRLCLRGSFESKSAQPAERGPEVLVNRLGDGDNGVSAVKHAFCARRAADLLHPPTGGGVGPLRLQEARLREEGCKVVRTERVSGKSRAGRDGTARIGQVGPVMGERQAASLGSEAAGISMSLALP